MAMIGIARVKGGFRNAVIGGDNQVGRPVETGEAAAQANRQGRNIARVVVESRRITNSRLQALALEPGADGVDDRGVCRGAILRIKRHNQNAAATLAFQRVEFLGDRWRAIAHRPAHQDLGIGHGGGGRLGLGAGNGAQRRFIAFAIPDARISGARFLRPGHQDDAMQ